MKFSDEFKFKVGKTEEWFNPILSLDTKIFIDPFLLYSLERDEFAGSHSEVISFFNLVFQFIARSKGDKSNIFWRRATNLLLFPEAEEFCIGYASQSTKGAGSGLGFAKIIAEALWEAVESGKTELKHFEEVGILREGIGADRISDITATILKKRFSDYTQRICSFYKLPMNEFIARRGVFDPKLERWMPIKYLAPYNRYNQKPILLTPRRFLRDLPTISANDFWDYCWYNENESLRDDYSADITKNVDKQTIVSFAINHPDIRDRYLQKVEERKPEPYDLNKDKKGYIQWYDSTAKYCIENPHLEKIDSLDKLSKILDSFLKEFVNYVENNSGWKLLWNDNGVAKGEEAAQLLFLGIIKHYCKANNIDISKEVNIGRGPVDFKVSIGYALRALIELKLAKNTKFWNGLKKQLIKYLDAEGITVGYFVVVTYNEEDIKRLNNIHDITSALSKKVNYKLKTIIVDASNNKLSASIL